MMVASSGSTATLAAYFVAHGVVDIGNVEDTFVSGNLQLRARIGDTISVLVSDKIIVLNNSSSSLTNRSTYLKYRGRVEQHYINTGSLHEEHCSQHDD